MELNGNFLSVIEEFESLYSNEFLNRLDNINQWSEKDVIHRETVSQHSFKVAIFSRLLVESLFKRYPVDLITNLTIKLQVTTYALFHDFDEALILRDISHETKYNRFNGVEIRDALNSLVDNLLNNEFGPDSFVKKSTICEDELCKSIVKYCDWICLKRYIKIEDKLGNKSLNEIGKYCDYGINDSASTIIRFWKNKFGVLINLKDLS